MSKKPNRFSLLKLDQNALIRHSDWGSVYVPILYTERLAQAEANYFRQLAQRTETLASLQPTGLHENRGDSCNIDFFNSTNKSNEFALRS